MPLRDELEIQKAHDAIIGILLGEAPIEFDPIDKCSFHIAADVLCWVLQHDHNKGFSVGLGKLYAHLEELGIELKLSNHGN
jgi:hypothetical protein